MKKLRILWGPQKKWRQEQYNERWAVEHTLSMNTNGSNNTKNIYKIGKIGAKAN